MIYSILYILYILVVLAVVAFLLLTGTRPTKTLAWLLVIIMIPVAGIIFYFMLGINRRKYKFYKIQRNKEMDYYLDQVAHYQHSLEEENAPQLPEIGEHLKMVRLIIRNSNLLPVAGNKVDILEDGPDTFDAIFEALRKARHFIHMQYYILEEGELAEQLLEIVREKVEEGVEVRVIYDGFGSFGLSSSYLNRLEKAGVEAFGFLPLRFGFIMTSMNYRNHRKIIVVDGEVGFTGGINLADKYINGDELGDWHDIHLRIEGPVVSSLNAIFSIDWYFVSSQEQLLESTYFPTLEARGDRTVQMVASGPDTDYPGVLHQYFTIITQAKNYIYIANPYIIPGEVLLEALKIAALSGVDVRLLLPEKSDSWIVKWSIRSYLEEFLQAGIRIFLYKKSFLHSKIIVADNNIASVGTANLDIRSFEQNFEVNAVIYSKIIAQQLRESFQRDCQHSVELKLEDYLQRPRWRKLVEGIARVFSPLL